MVCSGERKQMLESWVNWLDNCREVSGAGWMPDECRFIGKVSKGLISSLLSTFEVFASRVDVA